MSVSKKLQRQFKKSFGNADFDQEILEVITHLRSLPSLTPDQEQLAKFIDGFQAFTGTVEASYEQADKMLGMANRSLSISSEELNASNGKLKELNRTVETLLNNLGEGIKAAREIQQSLMPPLHQEFESVLMDVFYHPSEDLSGDFFDVYQQGPWLYFYLADVTSHGTASAQVTYLIKGIFQEIMSSSPVPLELDFLIKDFCRRFVQYKLTYAVGLQTYRFNLNSKILEVCASNAPAPILTRSGGSLQILIHPGPLIFAETFNLDYVFMMQKTQLEPGDSVYCFTDGAFELNNMGDAGDFNERKFAKLLSQVPHQGWEENILNGLQAAAGKSHFDDDITILRLHLK